MMDESYRRSFRKRLSILFSPLRLVLFVAAIIFGIVINVVYLRNGAEPEWLGAISILPVSAFLAWSLATDYRHRRREIQEDARD